MLGRYSKWTLFLSDITIEVIRPPARQAQVGNLEACWQPLKIERSPNTFPPPPPSLYIEVQARDKHSGSETECTFYNFMSNRQLSGFESRHLSKIQNGRHKQRGCKHTLAHQKIYKIMIRGLIISISILHLRIIISCIKNVNHVNGTVKVKLVSWKIIDSRVLSRKLDMLYFMCNIFHTRSI